MTRPDVVAAALPPGAAVRESAALVLPPDPRSVSVARRFVRRHAAVLDDEGAHALLLLTSELVTNAVVHARTEVEVAVLVGDEAVVVAVHDLDLGRREQHGAERDGGRGMGIVASLAQQSGWVRHREGGKTAWFRLGRPGAGAAARPGAGEAR